MGVALSNRHLLVSPLRVGERERRTDLCNHAFVEHPRVARPADRSDRVGAKEVLDPVQRLVDPPGDDANCQIGADRLNGHCACDHGLAPLYRARPRQTECLAAYRVQVTEEATQPAWRCAMSDVPDYIPLSDHGGGFGPGR